MSNSIIGIWVKMQNLVAGEKGQDLVEYSMAFSVIALGTVAGMASVAAAVTTVFATIAALFTINF